MGPASDSPTGDGADGLRHAGTLEDSIMLGSVVHHHVRLTGGMQMVVQQQDSRRRPAPERGAPVLLDWAPEDCQMILQD